MKGVKVEFKVLIRNVNEETYIRVERPTGETCSVNGFLCQCTSDPTRIR